MSLLAYLTALLALTYVQADDRRLAQCKRNGWVFLPRVQQKSWQAIMQCTELRDPGFGCQGNPYCFGFTSNGNSGTGWMYRLPPVKECKAELTSKSLQLEWPWSWVPMTCQDDGPCCGTYIAHNVGPNAAFELTCDSSDGDATGSSFDPFSCPKKCPTLHTTHLYINIQQWEFDCSKQRQAAGLGDRRRGLLGDRGRGFRRQTHRATLRKETTDVAQVKQQAFIFEAKDRACSAVSSFCESS